MQKKLAVGFAFFPYAGNSTGSSMVFDVTEWLIPLIAKIKTSQKYLDRIERTHFEKFCDTPITMTRNRAVKWAQERNIDVLIMLDSDMRPDLHVGKDPHAEPFFDVAFDSIYDHYERGPLVIGAPYGGCPPHENMFVFKFRGMMNAGEETPFKLDQYTREEAALMHGLGEVAALPTGVIAYDIRAFDLIPHPYFKYEFTDEAETEKASTEDVVNTRDIALAGRTILGYNPLRCAWSSWAGHLKTWCVDKPQVIRTDDVADSLAKAVERGIARDQSIIDLGADPRKKWPTKS